MENNRDGFFLYKSFYDAIQFVPNEKSKLRLYQALAEYAILDKEPDISGWEMALFITWKTNVDKSVARREAAIFNGEKGGRPKKVESKPNNNPVEPNIKPNTKVNNLNKKLDNKKKPNTNLNNNINSEIENDVEVSCISLEDTTEQFFISNPISDDPVEGVIDMNNIVELDKEFGFNERYKKLIEDNPSTSFEKRIFNLILEYDEIFYSINISKYDFEYCSRKEHYLSIIEKDIDPINIFYELVKVYQRD
jgi:hypothetical protein